MKFKCINKECKNYNEIEEVHKVKITTKGCKEAICSECGEEREFIKEDEFSTNYNTFSARKWKHSSKNTHY